jgi:hypothetical protein
VQVVVARRSPAGAVAVAVFLVDLACLGVKDAFARVFTSLVEYEQQLRRRVAPAQTLVPADLDLVARIIRDGIAYARQLGFEPHPDYHTAAVLLQGAQPDACRVAVPLGKEGKPFCVAGPRDDIPRILAQLTRSVGAENFEYLIPLDMPREFLDEPRPELSRRACWSGPLGTSLCRLERGMLPAARLLHERQPAGDLRPCR